MIKTKRNPGLFFLISAIMILLSCGQNTPLQAPVESSGSLSIRIELADSLRQVKSADGTLHKAMLTVGSGVVIVSASDMQTLQSQLTVTSHSFSGKVSNVPAGVNRNVRVELYGNGNQLMFAGENTTDVTAGRSSSVAITLAAQQGIMIDVDGNIYGTVQIGSQWWMAENLRVTHYRNGAEIVNITGNSDWAGTSAGAYCYYNNSSSHAAVYGALYNWNAITNQQNIAPTGWHVPTDEDWKALEMSLGMSPGEANNTETRGTDQGGSLKETGTTHWGSPNTGATNVTGFTALPGGYRYDFEGTFGGLGNYAYFWTASEYNNSESYAWVRRLNSDNAQIYRSGYPKNSGYAVRLVRD